MPLDDRYRIHSPDQIYSPGLVVFREIAEENLETMIRIAGNVSRLRPHCKTHKMPAITELQLAAGITKHKAATFAEAEMLAEAGATDIFLAYNIVGPNVARAVKFRHRYPDITFSVTADHEDWIVRLGAAMVEAGTSIHVFLDINPGRDRTGVPAGEIAAELYRLISHTEGLIASGFHLYDGHLHQHDLNDRKTAVNEYWSTISAFRQQLESEGLSVPKIVCGGTPTFPAYAEIDDGVIELSPGTCTFHDASYGENFPDLNCFTPAALILTRVISRPTENRVTFDVGTKAVASDPPMGTRVTLPEIPDAVQVLQNEEHLVVETEHASEFHPGDWTLAIPRHVCPTSALHREATIISNGEIVGSWEVIGRDRLLTI